MSGQRSAQEDSPAGSNVDSESILRSRSSASSERSYASRFSFLATGFRSVLRGEISASAAARELLRRAQVMVARRHERRMLADLASQEVQLQPEFQKLSSSELLKHFKERSRPAFLPGFDEPKSTAKLQRRLLPNETRLLLEAAESITRQHRWLLLGYGEKDFGSAGPLNWNRDPLSGRLWPLDYHATISLWHDDGSDIRVLWELNRLAHLITLGRAYALTKDEKFSEEFFLQVDGWREQNPVGRGANWTCAMEVALRAMNLLAAYLLFRKSPAVTEERLLNLLTMLDQHGSHIRRNLEFSNIATSNHYLSDIVGLLWLGIMLPELGAAAEWRRWAMAELLREMDKQILPDGADYEASTGYHRFVLELFLYSFILCDNNDIVIDEQYWQKLREMFGYVRGTLRPDGRAPLIGDTDGGQVLPIARRSADDHAYVLAFGAVIFADAGFKLDGLGVTEELLWTLGPDGVRQYGALPVGAKVESQGSSQAFRDAGTYLLRSDDLYLLFNLSGAGGAGRGSHGHNDALSIEVSACGRAFIVDPGAYVYTADLQQRHLFRSTAWHSTIQIDDAEQNTTNERVPFVIGDEAHPRLLDWQSTPERDYVRAEHAGYARLAQPTIHRRTVTFEKAGRWWLVEDEILGDSEHTIAARFHFDAGLEVETGNGSVGAPKESLAVAWDKMSGARLFVCALDAPQQPQLEPRFTSKQYGSKLPSFSACWSVTTSLPCKLRWAIVPVCAGESLDNRLRVPSLKPEI